jgi:tetratricopeptide (TPR) repeat protein
MRYVPNLIPTKSKVLHDYFKGSPTKSIQANGLSIFLYWLLGLLFFAIAILYIIHPILLLLFSILGLITFPPGNRWLERIFRFQYTIKAKSISILAVCIIAFPLVIHYGKIDKIIAQKQEYESQIKAEQKKEDQIKEQKAEEIRLDSLRFYTESSNNKKPEEALKQLEHALIFTTSKSEIDEIKKIKIKILFERILALVNAGKYKKALPELNDLISKTNSNSELLYNRAICYSKTGNIQEAVNDCNKAISLGNKNAENLYDKINPIKKRVSYYVTRCCDGSTSNSSGRGTCSHHGGVCDWNEPVYEEYRKY